MLQKRPIAIAPMLDWTNRHYRYLARLISQHVFLYTEMIAANALIYGKRRDFLDYHSSEHPLALQVGGSEPAILAECAKMAEQYAYDEINLNIGCPSDRVQAGRFGACLMAEPNLVAECVAAMRATAKIPVTVKTRIGIDDQDHYENLTQFVATVAKAGCEIFIVHARKAWLKGLSPKENRTIPPLHYDRVYQLKKDFPQLTIIINGGITDNSQISTHLTQVDGVMIGREAYHNPYLLASFDRDFYQATHAIPTRNEILQAYADYVKTQHAQGISLATLIRPLLGLFQGIHGARAWRRYLTEQIARKAAANEIIWDRYIECQN